MVQTLEENLKSKKTLKTYRWVETTAQNTQGEGLLKNEIGDIQSSEMADAWSRKCQGEMI